MVIDSVLEVRGIIFVYTIIVMRNVLEGQQMVTAELTAYLSTHRDGYGAASPAHSHQGAWIFPNVGYFFLALFVGTLFAFWPPYLSHLPNTDVYAHFHAIVAVIWCGLLIAQPLRSARTVRCTAGSELFQKPSHRSSSSKASSSRTIALAS